MASASAARAVPARVQALVESGASHLPPQYIQPPELRPDPLLCDPPAAVPVVDLAGDDPIAAVQLACADWGAFQVVNHGVPLSVLDSMKAAGLTFFTAPMDAKLRFSCDPGRAASEGYGSRMLEKEGTVLDWRDYFDHHTLPSSRRDPRRWPDFVPNYRDIVVEYSKQMKDLAQNLLYLISKSLNLPPSYIEDAVGEVYQNITISYYSPCPQPDLALGLQPHSDIGVITLLIQDDVGGLEVLRDQWVPLQPHPGAIIVLLSDQMEILSNGKYKSAVHRVVVNSNKARISVATFYDPSKTRTIQPAPELSTEGNPVRYRSVIYGDYISSWYGIGPHGKRNIEMLRIQE